jgi:hypothetical protein
MRNPLDTASVAQSLDGERLMGCLHYPGRRIFLAQSGYKDLDLQQDTIIDRNRYSGCRRIRCITWVILREFVSTTATNSSTTR